MDTSTGITFILRIRCINKFCSLYRSQLAWDALTQGHGLQFELIQTMMKFVCWARVSQALLLTMHTTGLTNKMHLFRAYISLVWFATHRKVTGGVHEEFTAWEAQARDLKSGPNTRVIFCSPRHSYGRWEDYTDMETMQELNQIPCLKPDSLPPYSSGRFSCGSTHNCSQSVLPCLFPEATCTCSTRPGSTIGILADLSHSLVACMKQNKQTKSFGMSPKIYRKPPRWGG